MYGTNNQFIRVRRRSTVQAGSIGGAATDSMTSEIHISGTSDPEVGYVSVVQGNDKAIKYTWTPATTKPPIITAPEEGVVINETDVPISGTGVVGAEVTVYYGLDKHANVAKVDVNGKWSVAIAAADLGTQATIAATQTISGMGSVSSDPVSFRGLTTLEAPVITVPSNGQKDISLTPTIRGTGEAGATVEVKSGNDVILSTTVGDDKKWSAAVTTALTAGTEYTITATQKIGSVVSTASTAVKFTTVSA